jgi:Fe-S-cluster-containing dehydrogenase component
MNYGFVINNKTCIGCHACSTACKSENEVPLGVYRTWVKYVEKGEFPNSKRYFQVTRCNHCANPPCVRICPVTAMYQRTDGIVEFDPEVCIGCKACMQACPYDAIYIDPDTHSAAKCHYCSHRTDLGLEPACVVVCPTRSIIAGDLNNPDSDISRILAREQVNVRKPEQGTAPNLFYVEGDDVGLTPTAAQANFMWSELVSEQNVAAQAAHSQNGNGHFNSSGEKVGTTSLEATATTKMANSGVAIRAPQAQGVGYQGPIHIGEGRLAEHMVQTTYNAQHKVPWHWPVPAYLVTKGIGSGIFVLLAIFFGLKIVDNLYRPDHPIIGPGFREAGNLSAHRAPPANEIMAGSRGLHFDGLYRRGWLVAGNRGSCLWGSVEPVAGRRYALTPADARLYLGHWSGHLHGISVWPG